MATTRTDTTGGYFPGYFRFESLPVGTYFVRAELPDAPTLAPGLVPNVPVRANDVVSPGIFLPEVASRGTPYLRLWLRSNNVTAVCNTLFLYASVGDANGEPVAFPPVTWTSSDPAVATIGAATIASWTTGRAIKGVGAGYATIGAASGAVSDSLRIQVYPNSITCPNDGPVARVEVSPENATIAVGDTIGVIASPRDTAGNLILSRPVTWSVSDSTVAAMEGGSTHITVRGLKAGSAVVRASVDGKTDSATIVVH